MILLVDMARLKEYDELNSSWRLKRRFEKISGHPCLVVNYPIAALDFVHRYGIKAIFIGGFGYGWGRVPVRKLHNISKLVQETDVPILGVCGGHQLIANVFNKDLRRVKKLSDTPMRKLKSGEADIWPEYHPGYLKERGIYEVKVVQQDPLFNGLPRKIRVPEYHYGEVKKLPKGFVLLATNDNCKIQAMRHRTRSVYGTQFHPENWDDAYPDGKRIITNFFRIAKLC